jgi:hypothetical protein
MGGDGPVWREKPGHDAKEAWHMAEKPSPFSALVGMTIGVLPEVSEGVRRNISDMNLLRAAAAEALARYPQQGLLALFADVVAQRGAEVSNELAALLMSLYKIDDDAGHVDILRQRFESCDMPEWLAAYSLHSYARAIIAEVVARQLIDAGGWERPAHLAPSRRGKPLTTSALTA